MLKHSSTLPASLSPGEDKGIPIPLTGEPMPTQHRFNVVLFGETGAGKSSVVNLITGLDHDVAQTSSSASSCTLDAREYDVTVRGQDFRIFDTVGLNEPQSLKDDPDRLIGAINKAYCLIKSLSDGGGVNLLVFCIRRGRITNSMQQNYKLFHDFLCHGNVPIALVVTHLENEEYMDDWWSINHAHFWEYGIRVVDHACITANRRFCDRYETSRQLVHDLLIRHGCGVPFLQERVSWVTELFQKLLDLVGFRPRFDSVKVRAKQLRAYGLRENEIALLLKKISHVDEDMALKPLRTHHTFPLLPGRRNTHLK